MDNVVRRAWRIALAFGIVCPSIPAHAQTTSAAEALFEEGRRLMEAGNYPAACEKLAESQRLDPAGGTLMNLAACHERAGRTATAWAEFSDALARAQQDGRQDRVREASLRIAELTPRLARITLTVSSPPPDVEVMLDGTLLGAPSWGTPIPVDPGLHQLGARAPGRQPWATRVSVEAATTNHVSIPTLDFVPVTATVAPVSEHARPGTTHSLRVPSFVVGGVGIAAVGVGIGFGIDAAISKSDSEKQCIPSGQACTTAGAVLLKQASTAAWASDIGFGAGAAALAVATYFFFATSRRDAAFRDLRVVPLVGAQSLGLGAGGVF
jgi:hypothetical protein